MPQPLQDRRAFIRSMMAASGAAAGLLPSIARALEIPARRRTGTIMDVEHVVILTQENRAFDHYFGAMRGVRGFGDRFAPPAPALPGAPARNVFVQANEKPDAAPALLAPFRLDTERDFRLIRPLGTPHGFTDSQAAWDNGRMAEWTRHKHNHAMAHFTREDIPFQYALAEAFTLCDAYHCALHLSTNPNRLYIWTGTHDPLAQGNGPAIDNGYDSLKDPRGHGGYRWKTYPERLMEAGISFQIYQDMEDNFTDNPLIGFRRYRDALSAKEGPEAELIRRTLTTRKLDLLKEDVLANRLPQVSWIVASAAYSEHPSASTPLQGAEYTAQVLDALTANPDVWARTVFLVNFDENDGFFDHVPPPAPPARDPAQPGRLIGATAIPADDEYHTHSQKPGDAEYLGRPYGLGPRVPLYAISPWSTGGYVASEVFDHTSVIRFLEARFGVAEPNISAWRRAVCGDLTSCFDFANPDDRSFLKQLPATRALSERAAALEEVRPELPAALTPPVQEAGLRRKRPTPYWLEAHLIEQDGPAMLRLANMSRDRAAVFHCYRMDALDRVPERYTVAAGGALTAPLDPEGKGRHDLFVLGPNGFHRRLRGTRPLFAARLQQRAGATLLRLENRTEAPIELVVRDAAYGRPERTLRLATGARRTLPLDLRASHGWYDVIVRAGDCEQRLAGHVESGGASFSDPAAHGPAPLSAA